jgi:DNA-binding NarL/FixJ family response regulator
METFHTLIAEDNAAFRQSLYGVLMRRFPFMQVAEAEDAREALRQGLSRRFDLIFMDIRLPYGNGLELTHTIKEIFVDTVICVLTSYDLPEYRDAAFRSGADLFMVKGDSTELEIVKVVELLFPDEIHVHRQ